MPIIRPIVLDAMAIETLSILELLTATITLTQAQKLVAGNFKALFAIGLVALSTALTRTVFILQKILDLVPD